MKRKASRKEADDNHATAAKRSEREVDEVGSWSEAKKKSGVGRAGPQTFDAAITWVMSQATREHMQQLIGALNFPTTPFWTTQAGQQWWDKNRGMLSKRSQTFITAVQQVHRRNREDELSKIREKEDAKDERAQYRDSYIEELDFARRVMNADQPFVLAAVYPIDKIREHDYRHRWISMVSRLVPPSKPSKRKHDIHKLIKPGLADQPVREACRPVICKVMIASTPEGDLPRQQSRFRAWQPNSETVIRPISRIEFTYLPPPMDNTGVHLSSDQVQTIIDPYNSNPENTQRFILHSDHVIKLQATSFWPHGHRFGKTNDNKLRWYTWLRTDVNGTVKSSPPGIYDDQNPQQPDTRHEIDGFTTVAFMELLPQETQRFRALAELFPTIPFITTVPQIWNTILEFQTSLPNLKLLQQHT